MVYCSHLSPKQVNNKKFSRCCTFNRIKLPVKDFCSFAVLKLHDVRGKGVQHIKNTSIKHTKHQLDTFAKLKIHITKADYEKAIIGNSGVFSSSSMEVTIINIYSPVKFIVLISISKQEILPLGSPKTMSLCCGISSILGTRTKLKAACSLYKGIDP